MADNDLNDLERAIGLALDPAIIEFVSDAEPSWVWDPAAGRIIWANKPALEFWHASSISSLAARKQSSAIHGNHQLTQISRTLAEGSGRLERLRFFRHGRQILLTCKVTGKRINGGRAVLVQTVGNKSTATGLDDVLDFIISSLPGVAMIIRSSGEIAAVNGAAMTFGFRSGSSDENAQRQLADIFMENSAGNSSAVREASYLQHNSAAGELKFEVAARTLTLADDQQALQIITLKQLEDTTDRKSHRDEVAGEEDHILATDLGPQISEPDEAEEVKSRQPEIGPTDAQDQIGENEEPGEGQNTSDNIPGHVAEPVFGEGSNNSVTADRGDEISDDKLSSHEPFADETPDSISENEGRITGEPDDKDIKRPIGAAALVEAVNNAFGAQNIVPFRGQETTEQETTEQENPESEDTSPLDENEQDAFQAIADALGAKLDRGDGVSAETHEEKTGSPSPITQQPHTPLGKMPDQSEFAALLARFPQAIFVYRGSESSGSGEPMFVNRAFLSLFGYGSIENIARAGGVAAVLPKSGSSGRNDQQNVLTDDIAIIGEDSSPSQNNEMFIYNSSGIRVPVSARLQAVKWAGQNAMMLTLRKMDIKGPVPDLVDILDPAPGRKELQSILDRALDGFLILDRDGVVKSLNQGANSLFSLDSGDVVGRNFSRLLRAPSDHRAEILFAAVRDDLSAAGLADGCDVIARVSGAADIPLFLKIHSIENAGNSLFCAVFSDISRWKAAETDQANARIQAEQDRAQAEKDNEQKSAFLAKISHEVRTPLNSIMGFAEAILEEEFGVLENERYREYVANIQQSGTHLLALINDLLDISKAEAGKLELDFASVDLNDVTATCVKLMQPDANKARIIIRSNLSPNLADVVADEQSMRQICLNLLSNAIKFTGPGGQVIVSTRLIETGEIELRFHDTGTGMDNREIEAVMQPYQQLDNNFTNTPGTGLGLPLTKALVEENRARFDLESSKGQGTLVKITFPVSRVLAD